MPTIEYERLNEKLFFERLANGLSVYILPKKGFHKTYATFSTKFGSIDNHFQVEGQQEKRVPDGIAHFLEHKMFEEPEGDVFARFAAHGASANAYTSFDRTVYLFSATENIPENLTTLIDFVQKPYFTVENVEKEKGIIGQEIKMYQDHPDWRCYYGLIEAMYHHHPVKIDIAGTLESISEISRETLYDCYRAFYHPSNMMLFVVGGVDPESVMQIVRANQAAKTFSSQGNIQRFFPSEPASVKESVKITKLPVSLPKCLIGFKEIPQAETGADLLRKECVMKLVLDSLFSPSSSLYQKLYEEQLISDNFGHEYNANSHFAFSVFGGETKDSEQLVKRLKEELARICDTGIDRDSFERGKKKKIGSFLRMLNSPEAIAGEFTKYRFKEADLFEQLPVYESIKLNEVNARLKDHVNWKQMTISVVKSEK